VLHIIVAALFTWLGAYLIKRAPRDVPLVHWTRGVGLSGWRDCGCVRAPYRSRAGRVACRILGGGRRPPVVTPCRLARAAFYSRHLDTLYAVHRVGRGLIGVAARPYPQKLATRLGGDGCADARHRYRRV